MMIRIKINKMKRMKMIKITKMARKEKRNGKRLKNPRNALICIWLILINVMARNVQEGKCKDLICLNQLKKNKRRKSLGVLF